jgi:nucleoside-diphosphate-sugar epimerase
VQINSDGEPTRDLSDARNAVQANLLLATTVPPGQ